MTWSSCLQSIYGHGNGCACGKANVSLETSQYEIRKKLGIGLHSVNLEIQMERVQKPLCWKSFHHKRAFMTWFHTITKLSLKDTYVLIFI